MSPLLNTCGSTPAGAFSEAGFHFALRCDRCADSSDRMQKTIRFPGWSALEAILKQLDRRTLLAGAPLALTSCTAESPYFGKTEPPSHQHLAWAMAADSVTLDPALAGAGGEAQIVRTIFEGLTNLHPRTVEPMAGVATHYDVS